MQKTNTRKTKLVVITVAILCLIVVVAMGAFTYAKYVSTVEMDAQSATVAKWGYVVNVQANNLFGDAYGTNEGVKIAYATTGNTVGVKANAENTNLVAPGTTGSMSFSINGSAEVRAKISVDVLDTSKTVVLKQGENAVYEPIKWSLTKNDSAVEGATNVDLATLITKVEELSQDAIEANTTINDSYTITWAWAFEGNDANDTTLGLIAAGQTVDGYTAELEVSFDMTITVEQIQGENA